MTFPMRVTALAMLLALLSGCSTPAEVDSEQSTEPVVNFDGTQNFLPSDELDSRWVVQVKAAPVYPQKSLRTGEQGCATVLFQIEQDGTTGSHQVIASTPSDSFNSSAIEAAEKFRYVPGVENPERVPVFTTNTFTFQIQPSNMRDVNQAKQEKLGKVCEFKAQTVLKEPLTPR